MLVARAQLTATSLLPSFAWPGAGGGLVICKGLWLGQPLKVVSRSEISDKRHQACGVTYTGPLTAPPPSSHLST